MTGLKPPMPYAGGKQAVADRIAELLPPHLHYVEPYAGALSVLLAKRPSRVETVNDINSDLVTFWRVLRDRPDDLARVCALTPHSRAELVASMDRLAELGEIEIARRVWVRLTQARSAKLSSEPVGWRFVHDSTRRSLAAYLDGYVARIGPAAERLRAVTLECRPALEVIYSYGSHADTCLYVDPPYLGETRGTTRLYEYEMFGDADHAELLDALTTCRASVVLSGYAHPLYDEQLAGWERYEYNVRAQSGDARTEVVWCNRTKQDGLW